VGGKVGEDKRAYPRLRRGRIGTNSSGSQEQLATAMGQKMAEDEDWQPEEEIKAARWELKEAWAWLRALELEVGGDPRSAALESLQGTPKGKSAGGLPWTKEEALRQAREILDEARQEWGEAPATGRDTPGEPEVESLRTAGRKRVPKVANDDLVEHELTGGVWEGFGAVRKGCEIRIGVSACIHIARYQN